LSEKEESCIHKLAGGGIYIKREKALDHHCFTSSFSFLFFFLHVNYM